MGFGFGYPILPRIQIRSCIWVFQNPQGADQDYFDAKNEDNPDPTGRVDSAWIQSGCRDT